jgi:hypothetical protein
MIQVVRIAGESFDIETGKQVSKALVLSNGADEVHVPVREDVIKAVLHLYWHAPERTKAPEPEVIVDTPVVEDVRDGTYDPRSGTASV